ncbi:MAG TPA: zinc ribbon domain-containing protein [Acidobacteriota bacterium]|jgi:putative FmdB family regulatory protein|nr:zinc ribbon domain-containing protein [Acidobacteriota bacterium]
MPVYEYLCGDCHRRFSRFFWRIGDAEGTKCRCGSSNLEQLVSRVTMIRSEESRLESMADPDKWGDIDENDPKSMARMMRKMSGELGEDLGPEFNEVVDRLEAGEDPESIEKSLGEAGEGDDSETGMSGGGSSPDYDNLF